MNGRRCLTGVRFGRTDYRSLRYITSACRASWSGNESKRSLKIGTLSFDTIRKSALNCNSSILSLYAGEAALNAVLIEVLLGFVVSGKILRERYFLKDSKMVFELQCPVETISHTIFFEECLINRKYIQIVYFHILLPFHCLMEAHGD